MLTSFHTAVSYAVGTCITYVTKNPYLGTACVFALHYPIDYLGENVSKGYQKYEIIFHALYLTLGIIYNDWIMFLIYALSGNLMDVIDKKLYLSILYPYKYSHWYIFHKKERNTLKLSKGLTKVITLFMIAILIIFITKKLF